MDANTCISGITIFMSFKIYAREKHPTSAHLVDAIHNEEQLFVRLSPRVTLFFEFLVQIFGVLRQLRFICEI